MDFLEFCNNVLSLKLNPAQKKIIRMIEEGKTPKIIRDYPGNSTYFLAKLYNEKYLAWKTDGQTNNNTLAEKLNDGEDG